MLLSALVGAAFACLQAAVRHTLCGNDDLAQPGASPDHTMRALRTIGDVTAGR